MNRPSGYVSEMHERSRYPDFPEPVATLKAGLVWAWPDVEKFRTRRGEPSRIDRTVRLTPGVQPA